MHRRDILATAVGIGAASLAGCSNDSTSSDPTPTPTDSPLTRTAVPFPDTCGSVPDIEGLPEPPTELTEERARSYVAEFERVYAVATNSEYVEIAELQVTSTATTEDGYRVQLEVVAEPATRTPDSDGETPTELPGDAYSHKVLYRLEGDRMLRVLLTYPDEAPLSQDCWTFSASDS